MGESVFQCSQKIGGKLINLRWLHFFYNTIDGYIKTKKWLHFFNISFKIKYKKY